MNVRIRQADVQRDQHLAHIPILSEQDTRFVVKLSLRRYYMFSSTLRSTKLWMNYSDAADQGFEVFAGTDGCLWGRQWRSWFNLASFHRPSLHPAACSDPPSARMSNKHQ